MGESIILIYREVALASKLSQLLWHQIVDLALFQRSPHIRNASLLHLCMRLDRSEQEIQYLAD